MTSVRTVMYARTLRTIMHTEVLMLHTVIR